MGKKLLGLVRFGPMALALSGVASAQSTGTIFGVVTDASTGKAVAGALVVATSPNLQGEQTATTDEAGHYRLILLPVGEYRLVVHVQGYQPAERGDVRLSADKTLRADLVATPEAVTLAEVVVPTGPPPVVDVGSAEAGSVVSRDFVAGVPVGRTFVELSGTVPQSLTDPFGAGFSGAQSPENGYLLDGFDITDPVLGTAPEANRRVPTLLSNFIQEVDVKTGSFLPEYGRSTGGIVNVVTKGGSNELHGSVFANLRPDFLVTPDGAVEGGDGEAIAWNTKPSAGSYNLDFGGEIGGPFIRDKLWFYAGFAPIITREYYDRFQRSNVLNTDPGQVGCYTTGYFDAFTPDPRCRDGNGFARWNKVPGSDQIVNSVITSYQWAGKLAFLLDADNTLSLASYGQPSTRTVINPLRAQDENAPRHSTVGSYDVIGHYAGKFVDRRLVVEVDGGWHGQRFHAQPNDFQASKPLVVWNDPTSYYGLTAFEAVTGADCTEPARCPVRGYATGGWGLATTADAIDRFAGKASLSWLVGAAGFHSVKAGVDLEHNRRDVTRRISGGYAFTARNGQFRADGYGYLANGSHTDVLSEVFPFAAMQSDAWSNNASYFLQDSWQVADSGLTVNAGVRLETQYIANRANAVDRLDITDSWAPRVQAIWDFTGTGRGKVAASWGRFFWAIPLLTSDVSFGPWTEVLFREPVNPCFPQLPQTSATRYFPGGQVYGQFDTAQLVNPASGLPACSTLAAFGTPRATFHQFNQPTTPVMPGLEGTAVDMFGGQLEYEIVADLSLGLEYAGRRLVSLVEDLSPDDGTHFFIANPGRNVTWDYGGTTYSAVDAVTYDSVTGRQVAVKFPKPERSYDGFTARMTKSFSRSWLAQASYTWSALRGNYSGPYMVDYNQLGGSVSAAYDLPTFLYNTTGYLPGDHTHVVKVYGSYTWTPSQGLDLTGGLGYQGWSGRPMNALGGHDLYGAGLAYVIQQGFAGRTPFTHQLDLRAALAWTFSPPYQVRLTIDAFNVLNQKTVVEYDQNYTYDSPQVIQRPGCRGDFVGTPDPAGKLQATCPDVKYLRTVDGRPITVNPNWGKPAWHQGPIQLRFGLALAF